MIFPTHIVAVAGITEDKYGNILLVKTDRGYWTFSGGQVEAGENLMDAVARETKAESNIDVEVLKLIGVYSNTGTYEGYNGVKIVPTKVMMDFTCKLIGGELGTSEETPESKWVKKEDVLNYIKEPNLVERFQAYLDFNDLVNYVEYVTKPEYEMKLKRMI